MCLGTFGIDQQHKRAVMSSDNIESLTGSAIGIRV